MQAGKVENTKKEIKTKLKDCLNVWELQNILEGFREPTEQEKKLNSSGMYIKKGQGNQFVYY